MMGLSSVLPLAVAIFPLIFPAVNGQFPGFGGGGPGGPGSGGGPGQNNPNGPNNPSSSNGQSSQAFSGSSLQTTNHVLAAHAVMACLAWLLFVPMGGIVLRLGIQSPWIVRVHAICQVLAYGVYIIAAAMGFWLTRQFSGFVNIWSNPHPIIGVVILIVALSQPLSGYIHHRKYKRRLGKLTPGQPRPGRTSVSWIHICIGRVLMILAVVNGGLGLRLAAPMQSAATSTNAKIIYAVLSGWMALLYVGITLSSELRRASGARIESDSAQFQSKYNGLPSYDESEESLGRGRQRQSE